MTHIFLKNDNPKFVPIFDKFYSECFFPELKKRGVTQIIQLGDFFDKRKFINFQTLYEMRRMFLAPLKENNMHMTTILGNHDIVFRDTVRVNSSSMLFDGYSEYVKVVSEPTEMSFGNMNVLMLPWICKENEARVFKAIERSTSPVCCGHLELKGFSPFRGHVMNEGHDHGILSRFDVVFSGHFHHRSHNHNIYYVGTPIELTWMDYQDQKGFHILDTETQELEFIPNPFSTFQRVVASEITPDILDQCRGKFVRLIVDNRNDVYAFDSIVSELQTRSAELKIIDDVRLEVDTTKIQHDAVGTVPDTLVMIETFVDALNTTVEKEKIKTFMRSLFVECQAAEV